ncbi:MAG TPA: hypothetical protein VHZ78_02070 [Rhizomicrobium sp.]|jgi:hypothetical protein|nr:hypothetical protein [Rhizomicrobium sp.]
MRLKTPWQDYRDRETWKASLPPEVRQAYQRFNLRQQYAILWIFMIVVVLVLAFKWNFLMPLPLLCAGVALFRQLRLERSLGLK